MLVKKKSLAVVLVSSFVISLVLVLTLIGYIVYLELKGEEFKRSYQHLMQKVNAKLYSKYIEVSRLASGIEDKGPLKGKPIIEGVLKNKGPREITSLFVDVKFLDEDGAIIYEVAFHPQEPALGASNLVQVAIPYISGPAKAILKPNGTLAFKKILTNCPKEITMALREKIKRSGDSSRWSGKLLFEPLSIDFSRTGQP